MDAPLFNFHDIVLLITSAISLIFVILRFVVAGKVKLASMCLSVFFVAIAFNSICTMVLWNIYIELSTWQQHVLPYALALSSLIKGPALYFYVVALTQSSFSLRPTHLVHAVFPIVSVFYIGILNITSSDLLFETPNFTVHLSFLVNTFWYFIKVVPVGYAIVTLISLFQYKKRLKNQFSDFVSMAPNWLNVLTVGFGAAWWWTLSVNYLGNKVNFEMASVLGILDNYVMFVLVVSLFIYSMSFAHKLLLTHDENESTPQKDVDIDPLAIEKVNRGIEELSLHLKPNINIEQFSDVIELPYRDTSAVINKHIGTNFFEFINRHRVEEAKKKLADKNYEHLSIMEIYMECGFNSSSAFQRFFKRLTGTTPSAYRKKSLSQQA